MSPYLRLKEVLLDAGRKPLFRAAADVQAQRGVDPVHAFVIPRSPRQAQPVVRLPEADRRMLGDKRVQRVDHRVVLRRLRSVPVRAPGQAHRPAALTDAHAVLGVHVRDQPALLARAQSFFSTASFRASWTKDRSAYIFFERAFSASRPLMRFSSLAERPPYLAFQLYQGEVMSPGCGADAEFSAEVTGPLPALLALEDGDDLSVGESGFLHESKVRIFLHFRLG